MKVPVISLQRSRAPIFDGADASHSYWMRDVNFENSASAFPTEQASVRIIMEEKVFPVQTLNKFIRIDLVLDEL
jgi:hypothetical protein